MEDTQAQRLGPHPWMALLSHWGPGIVEQVFQVGRGTPKWQRLVGGGKANNLFIQQIFVECLHRAALCWVRTFVQGYTKRCCDFEALDQFLSCVYSCVSVCGGVHAHVCVSVQVRARVCVWAMHVYEWVWARMYECAGMCTCVQAHSVSRGRVRVAQEPPPEE